MSSYPRFIEQEEPVRRGVKTSSVLAAGKRKQVTELRGFQLYPPEVSFGVLCPKGSYATTVTLKNVGIDSCRFQIKCPRNRDGLSIRLHNDTNFVSGKHDWGPAQGPFLSSSIPKFSSDKKGYTVLKIWWLDASLLFSKILLIKISDPGGCRDVDQVWCVSDSGWSYRYRARCIRYISRHWNGNLPAAYSCHHPSHPGTSYLTNSQLGRKLVSSGSVFSVFGRIKHQRPT